MSEGIVPNHLPAKGANVRFGPKYVIPILIFFVILVAGEFYVKWDPYYHKTFIAAAKHSIGASIVSGKTDIPPALGLTAAWNYAIKYFLAIWEALVLGIVVGAAVQVLLPKAWIVNLFARKSFASVAKAGTMALPGMMCTFCSAPITAGLRKQEASVGAALAFWMGNPVLNPATIIFMGFVLGWKFALFRIVFGILLVFGVSFLAERFAGKTSGETSPSLALQTDLPNDLPANLRIDSSASSSTVAKPLWLQFLTQVWKMAVTMLPAYIVLVLIVGGVRAWFFPVVGLHATGILWLIGLALAGTLFVIPTAGEVPIVQTLLHYGLGIGPAAALLLTLPTISAPSMAIVWNAFPKKALFFTAAATFVVGVIGGLLATMVL